MDKNIQSNYCSIYIRQSKEINSKDDILDQLKKDDIKAKTKGLKALIVNIQHDPTFPQLLMQVIQYIIPQEKVNEDHHKLKQTLLYYWEVLNKIEKNGQIIETIVLVVNSIRKDLESPNEYIRGRTLKMVSRLMYKPILDSLIQPILKCLDHSNIYVRRNAVFCVYNIQIHFGDELFTDIEDKIIKILTTESDLSCKRNAFLLLFQISQDSAFEWLNKQIQLDTLSDMGDILQVSILDLFRKTAKFNKSIKNKLLKSVIQFRESRNDSVKLECANTQLQIATTSNTLQRATEIYIQLLNNTSNNNLKLIALQKFEQIQQISPKYLQDSVSDLVKTLSCNSVDISRKCLNLIIPLVNGSNIQQIIQFFSQEIKNINNLKNQVLEENLSSFRLLLLETLNQFIDQHQGLSQDIISIISENLLHIDDLNEESCLQLKQILNKLILIRGNQQIIVQKLADKLELISNQSILKGVISLIGSYSISESEVESSIKIILKCIGHLPIEQKKQQQVNEQTEQQKEKKTKTKTVILEDGTYGTVQIKEEDEQKFISEVTHNEKMREALINDSYFGSLLGRNLLKLLNRIKNNGGIYVKLSSQVILVYCSLLRLYMADNENQESSNKLNIYLKFLLKPKLFQNTNCDWLYEKINVQVMEREEIQHQQTTKGADEPLNLRALKQNDNLFDIELDDEEIQIEENIQNSQDFVNKLENLVQLTGYSDPIYAEAFVIIEKFQINFEVLLINRSNKPLQKVQIEFIQKKKDDNNKIIKKAEAVDLKSMESATVFCCMKFNLSEISTIFGSIDFENTAGIEQEYLITKEINLDLIDFIKESNIQFLNFVNKWNKFDWEYRVVINSRQMNAKSYVQMLIDKLKFTLVNQKISELSPSFNCINMYAKTILNDDILLNISLQENEEFETIQGNLSVRSSLKGIVVNLGEKIKSLTGTQN